MLTVNLRPVVFVVDHDPSSRNAVDRLTQTMNLRCQGYSSGREFLAGIEPATHGCVVLEVSLPDINGLEVQRRLGEMGSPLPVVFLGSQPSVSIVVRAMRAGAVHFIQKPLHDGEMWDAIMEAVRLSEQRREQWRHEETLRSRIAALTSEERALIGLIMTEKSSKAIASRLDVCVRTVELRRSRLMKKLGVGSILELAEIALAVRNAESGLVSSPAHDPYGISTQSGRNGYGQMRYPLNDAPNGSTPI